MLTRKPAVAGSFYAADPNKLANQLQQAFKACGEPEKPTDRKIIAGIVPHAGYTYSGSTATYAYKAMAESKRPDTIILLGPDHRGLGTSASIWQGSAWETPLGQLEIDYELGRIILQEDHIFNKELDPHQEEHSLEVQLPFIQAIYKDPPKIIPVSISTQLDIAMARRMGEAIYRATKGRNIIFLASSDFTHYGVNYGYFPFFGSSAEVEKQVHELDMTAIKAIEAIKPDEFLDHIQRTKATICGAMPIAILLNTLKSMKIEKGKLLKYATSADVTGDRENFVAYASIIFEK